MASRIKGITVEIGGDTSGLQQALSDVDKKLKETRSSLSDVNKLLKFDPGNAELLAQKQKLLGDAVKETSERLETLKTAASQASDALAKGDISQNQYDALQREIIDTENKLNTLKSQAKETESALGNIGDDARESASDLDKLADAADDAESSMDKLGEASGTALKVGAAGIAAAGAALVGAAEETRDYRTEQLKLNTAFEQAGYSTDEAYSAYSDLQALMGESDTAVEAANHLAQLCDSEKELSTWTGDILPGVFATFGDSLPLEGLTEAANETAKVGAVTGSLADALNWVGISEDEFNAQLEQCSTEQERQALITSTLASAYGETSAAYKQNASDIMAANSANEAWTNSLAQVGAAVEPIITKVKIMAASLLESLVPAIQWAANHLTIVCTVLGTLGGILAAVKIASFVQSFTAIPQVVSAASTAFGVFKTAVSGISTVFAALPTVIATVRTALTALFAVLSANPIGLVVVAVTALIAIFVTLWNKCEAFRDFWTNVWEKIKSVATTVANAVKTAVQKGFGGMVTNIKTKMTEAFNTVKTKLTSIKNTFTGLASKALGWGKDMIQGFIKGIKSKIEAVGNAVTGIASKIKSILHFSKPDEGPLREYEKWMPDFMKGLAKGIREKSYIVEDAINELAGKMQVTVDTSTALKNIKIDTSQLKDLTVSASETAVSQPETVRLTQPLVMNGKTLTTLISEIQYSNGRASLRNLGRA